LVAGFCLIITLIPSQSNSRQDDFEKRWITLTSYDEGTKNAIQQLEIYGSDAIDELKKVLRATNDLARLPIAAGQIAQEFKIKIEKSNIERTAREAREIQERIEADKVEFAARTAKDVQDKKDAENRSIWMKRSRYALIGLVTLVICSSPFVYKYRLVQSQHRAAEREKTENEQIALEKIYQQEKVKKGLERDSKEQIEQAKLEKSTAENNKIIYLESSLYQEAETYSKKGMTSRAKAIYKNLANNGKDSYWRGLALQALVLLDSFRPETAFF
jgi:hypothetical protein